MALQKKISAFTDGSCLGNPGPGGWACILRYQDHEKVLASGYRHTTNNRMEIMGVLMALDHLTEACHVTVYSDSQYVCNTIEKRWLQSWQKNGWRNASKKPVKNRDLWERLSPLLIKHQVRMQWVKGHAGHIENERCDYLARTAAEALGLPEDSGFEQNTEE